MFKRITEEHWEEVLNFIETCLQQTGASEGDKKTFKRTFLITLFTKITEASATDGNELHGGFVLGGGEARALHEQQHLEEIQKTLSFNIWKND